MGKNISLQCFILISLEIYFKIIQKTISTCQAEKLSGWYKGKHVLSNTTQKDNLLWNVVILTNLGSTVNIFCGRLFYFF